MAQQTNDPVVAAILAQHASGSQKKQNSNKKFDLKNYFSLQLPDGVESGEKTIRILPQPDGSNPFIPMFVHSKLIDGQWKKFTCLHDNYDKDCPFCETRRELLGTGKESDKELAKKYGSRKMYVLRVIDRDHEEEGVKFWRFNHDYTNKGTYDKMVSIFKAKGDISHAENGRDLIINIVRDHKNNCVVSNIIDCDKSPALDDLSKFNEYVNDPRTWEDVYAVKDYEYLSIIVTGGTPVYDKENKMWVDKATMPDVEGSDADSDDDEIVMGGDLQVTQQPNTVAPTKSIKVTKSPIPVVASNDDDSDLPF